MVWPRIERKLDQTLLKNTSRPMRYIVIAIVIIALELLLVTLISVTGKLNLVDTIFVCSMLLLCLIWLTPLFNQQRRNQQNVKDRLYSGAGIDMKVEAFHMRFTPFVMGSTGFAVIGLITAFVHYRTYFF
jgi:hypothetical protein